MAGIRRKIRLIVDEGAVQCPICKGVITAGHGHRCSQEDEVISGCDFKLPVVALGL